MEHSINNVSFCKILDRSKLKAFADDTIDVIQKLILVLEWVENIVVKGENAVYQHFLLFSQCFQKHCLSGSLKVGIVWYCVIDSEREVKQRSFNQYIPYPSPNPPSHFFMFENSMYMYFLCLPSEITDNFNRHTGVINNYFRS